MVRCGQEGGVAADEEILGGEARGGEEVEPGTTLPVGDGRDEAEVLADMPLADPLTLITRAAECVMAEAEVLTETVLKTSRRRRQDEEPRCQGTARSQSCRR